MTQNEFLHKYHDYVQTKEEATLEAGRVNEEGIEGNRARVVCFPGIGCTLMLESAVSFLRSIDDDSIWQEEGV